MWISNASSFCLSAECSMNSIKACFWSSWFPFSISSDSSKFITRSESTAVSSSSSSSSDEWCSSDELSFNKFSSSYLFSPFFYYDFSIPIFLKSFACCLAIVRFSLSYWIRILPSISMFEYFYYKTFSNFNLSASSSGTLNTKTLIMVKNEKTTYVLILV